MPDGTALEVEIRVWDSGTPSKFFHLGRWTGRGSSLARGSVRGQGDDVADVETDTLVLRRPSQQFQVRLTAHPGPGAVLPKIKFLGLSFAARSDSPPTNPPSHGPVDFKPGAGRLPVPEQSQRGYAGGRDWCSPTSVSMVLAYWSDRLHRPELAAAVPEVAAGVHDPNWPGTGNWPFNTAFAGAFAGMRAYVTRLRDDSDLKALVAVGVPPVLSVSYDLLRGKAGNEGTGHLIVCTGFTESGDVLVNDPWAWLPGGESVRRVIPRDRLLRAWRHSRQTVYLIHPSAWPMPDGHGRW
jgi:hypothetical protein